MEYEAVIGLEVHLQLRTRTKLFCGCSTRFGAPENTQVCPVCLGLPGVLPVVNRMALEYGILAGLALNCTIAPLMKFDRKHYFYPDLPKNFQISQFDKPLAAHGHVLIDTGTGKKRIGIVRAHLEEDAGKLIHAAHATLVDYNRTGTPLLEIVSAPDLSSPDEAYAYLAALKSIFQYLDVSDCVMEEGSLRCDANVSIRPRGETALGTKTELKNMNSFKHVRDALAYEIGRQQRLVAAGGTVVQETRLWNVEKEVTVLMRSKEEAHDYRYFPEPDLPPFEISAALVESIRAHVPELPAERRQRFMTQHGLCAYDAEVLTADRHLADFFEEGLRQYAHPKTLANWLMGDVSSAVNARGLSGVHELGVPPVWITDLLKAIDAGSLSGKMAKELFASALTTQRAPLEIAAEKGLSQISDTGVIEQIADEVIRQNPRSVNDYRNGKTNALMFLVGQVMQRTKGKANPQLANEIIRKRVDVLSPKDEKEGV